jgi:hypothetical protein
VRHWVYLLPFLAACSGLEESEVGVVGLEVQVPDDRSLEVGEQVQVTAQALNADGVPVDAVITWSTSSAAVTVDATGLVTAASGGQADVQASVGSLSSERIAFTVLAPADTLIIEGDSVVVVPATADPLVTPSLVVRLESRSPPGPAPSRPVIYEITQPVAGTTPSVQLTGSVQVDTLTTSGTGQVTGVSLGVVTGQLPPDTAIVVVRAVRPDESIVPGSGQRFIVLFQ